MIGFHLRVPLVIRRTGAGSSVVRTGYEYGEEVDGQKYIGRHHDQNGVWWTLWDACPSVASLLTCDDDTRFRGTQSDYEDVRSSWSGVTIPVAYSAPSRDELVEKITAFASEPQPMKSTPSGGDVASTSDGDTTRPPKSEAKPIPKATPGYTPPPSSKSPLIAKAPPPTADGSLVFFVLLGMVGAGLIAMKLLA